ncbi:hypothetical protein BJ973_000452 [Actinoplanes tereljensis]|uniref:Lipoprotein n=1 Tax=Paractinoplanes tereljensis TaxID=571912 RepID=A0A919NSW7_9ACTN|nr:hypothetical protein [Actinoplanes tereljensis]GIF23192.1 hypothetical protein Ate02nite_59220 [Actinoplanes tereljensis]
MRRARRALAAIAAAMLLGVPGCAAGEASVEARLVDGELRLTFDPSCPVGFLGIRDRSTTLWEIRRNKDATTLDTVTVGVVPPGYTEVTDALTRDLPPELTLTVKTDGWFGTTIDLTALTTDPHRLDLSPVMNELTPAGDLC